MLDSATPPKTTQTVPPRLGRRGTGHQPRRGPIDTAQHTDRSGAEMHRPGDPKQHDVAHVEPE